MGESVAARQGNCFDKGNFRVDQMDPASSFRRVNLLLQVATGICVGFGL